MPTTRLAAFSDGVFAIIITIMVLELKAPDGPDLTHLATRLGTFLSYVLSFVYVGIYWNNHHHLLQLTQRSSGMVMWANLHLLFWLSLIPFVTAWADREDFYPWPAACYGFVLLLNAAAYSLLQTAIIRDQGSHSPLKAAIGADFKGKISLALYAAAIPLAFYNSWISVAIYIAVAVMWLIPDRRIETHINRASRNA